MGLPLRIRVKVSKMGNSLRITIPVDVVRTLNIQEGDFLEVGVTNDSIIARKVS
jgi:AbrB family looped-hinge helix DNA binding protein